MSEVAIAPHAPRLLSTRLNFRVQLWHRSEVGTSLELNSRLAYEAHQLVPSGWNTHFVEAPSFSCYDEGSLVPIEVEFIHDHYTHDHVRVPHEWRTLCRTVQEDIAPMFFKKIGGALLVCQIQSAVLRANDQTLLVAVDFRHRLGLVEKVIITPRPQSGWVKYWKYICKLGLYGLGISLASHMLPAGVVRSLATIGTVYSMVSYYSKPNNIEAEFSNESRDSLSRIADAYSLYRHRYADWKEAMSHFDPSSCPGSGMKAVEACYRLLIAFGEFHVSAVTYVNTVDLSPNGWRTAALVVGAIGVCCGLGMIGLSSVTLIKVSGGVGCLAGAGSAWWGWFDPNYDIRSEDLASKMKASFLGTQKSLRTLYVRTLVCFLQDGLRIPYDRLSEEETTGLLKSCNIDATFLSEVGYPPALRGRGTAHFEHEQGKLRGIFERLFSALGHDIILQAVPPKTVD